MTLQYLSQTTLASNAASITISAIPQTATDLVIYFSGRNTNTDDIFQLLPNNNSFNLTYRGLYNGSTVGASAGFIRGMANSSNSISNGFSAHIITIPNYADNKDKIIYAEGGYADSNNSYCYAYFGKISWNNTAAITSLVFSSFANFLAGTSVTVYTRTKS